MPAKETELRNGVQEFLERLQRNKYDSEKWVGKSGMFLMREHLRRRVLWGEVLHDGSSYPWGDLAKVIDPDLSLTNAERHVLRSATFTNPNLLGHGEICEHILKWQIILNDTKCSAQLPKLPDPWEPMLRLIERGGEVRHENGAACRGMWIPLSGWEDRAKTTEALTDLSDAAMEKINKAFEDRKINGWSSLVAHL